MTTAGISEDDFSELDPYGEFTEDGWHVKAYAPATGDQPTRWTVAFHKTDSSGSIEDSPQRVEHIPMLYRPVFGFDVGDVAALEARVDEVLREIADTSEAVADSA